MKNQAKTNIFMYKLIDLIKAIFDRITFTKNKAKPKKNYHKDFYKPEFNQVLDEIEYPSNLYKRLAYSDYVHRRAKPKYREYEADRQFSYNIGKIIRNRKIKEKFLLLFK